MKYSEYVDVLVQNSECFSFDHYSQGLRKFIRSKVINGEIGSIGIVPIDSSYINTSAAALFLGETNRLNSRYTYISDLLDTYENDKKINLKETKYFKKLYKPYQKRNFITKYRVRREIVKKIKRVYKLYQWLKENDGDFKGVTSFISNKEIVESTMDYPISLKIKNDNFIHNYVQLDGSHRRCVASYLGYTEIHSIIVSLEELEDFIIKTSPSYISKYRELFFNLINQVKNIP